MKKLIILITVLFMISCNKADEPKPKETFTGTYVFKSELQTDVSFTIDFGFGPSLVTFKGTDILIGLLENAPCDDAENAAIELKDNKELYFTCIGESNELKAGTWDENADLTILTLNLASGPLKIEDITVSGGIISGTIKGFPLTQALLGRLFTGRTARYNCSITRSHYSRYRYRV